MDHDAAYLKSMEVLCSGLTGPVETLSNPQGLGIYDGAIGRILIPHSLKREILVGLHQKKVGACQLFPDFDGLGKHVTDLLLIESLADTIPSAGPDAGVADLPKEGSAGDQPEA
jgi:hypothetical protein